MHRDVLRNIAGSMHSDVAELDAAITRVQNAGSSLGSFSGWSTGSAFGGNVMSACTGFGQVGANTSDTQSKAAKNLTDSASSYDDAESTNYQAINSGPAATLNACAAVLYDAGVRIISYVTFGRAPAVGDRL